MELMAAYIEKASISFEFDGVRYYEGDIVSVKYQFDNMDPFDHNIDVFDISGKLIEINADVLSEYIVIDTDVEWESGDIRSYDIVSMSRI